MAPVKIGLIGGTGLEDPGILKNSSEKLVSTPYGEPSDVLKVGQIGDVDCVLLSRHGRQHQHSPSSVNYRANLWALKQEGVDLVLVSTACGSLKEEIEPGHLVFIHQFIDRTTKREQSFFDGTPGGLEGVGHIPMATPYCPRLRKLCGVEILTEGARELGIRAHAEGVCVAIEGPRFSTRAESLLFRSWGASVVNMTTVPEAVAFHAGLCKAPLAAELGLPYAAVALVTDYDCWHPGHDAVSNDLVLETFAANQEKAIRLLTLAVAKAAKEDWTDYIAAKKAHQRLVVLEQQMAEVERVKPALLADRLLRQDPAHLQRQLSKKATLELGPPAPDPQGLESLAFDEAAYVRDLERRARRRRSAANAAAQKRPPWRY